MRHALYLPKISAVSYWRFHFINPKIQIQNGSNNISIQIPGTGKYINPYPKSFNVKKIHTNLKTLFQI